jgi:hypothetical protein
VEEGLCWTPPCNAEECMMLFEIMYENEKDSGEFDVCHKGIFTDPRTKYILSNFLDGMKLLKTERLKTE